jgi:hypothetical protein
MDAQYFTLELHNTGGRGQDRQVSWSSQAWQWIPSASYDRARLVVKYQGQVYLTNDLMATLHMWPGMGPGLTLTGPGARRLWQLTPERMTEALEHCCYPVRTTHEELARERNLEALAWLEQLANS